METQRCVFQGMSRVSNGFDLDSAASESPPAFGRPQSVLRGMCGFTGVAFKNQVPLDTRDMPWKNAPLCSH